MSNPNNSVNNDQGFIGTGTPYFYPEDGSPVFFFGNPIACKIGNSSDEKVRKSKKRENPGASLNTQTTPNPSEVTLGTDTFQPRTWAMAMMGTAGKVTSAAQTITGEAAKAVLDGYYDLVNKDIDPATLVVSKAGAVLDPSAYTLNAALGLLQITDSTVAAAGDDLTVDYETEQTTKLVIEAAKVTSFKGKLVIDGENDVTKEPAVLTIPNVSLAVDGDFDWFSDDYNTIEMKGTASVGKNGEAPYLLEIKQTV